MRSCRKTPVSSSTIVRHAAPFCGPSRGIAASSVPTVPFHARPFSRGTDVAGNHMAAMTLPQRLTAQARRVPEWVVYIVGIAPAPWLFYLAATGGLGVEPIEALEHEYGRLALQLLIAGLCITPLRRFTGVNLLKFRRALGLLAFGYVVLHLLVWAVLDVQIVSQMWADILKRRYITVGMASLLLLLPLALTSNRWSVRKLGRGWTRLHWLVYLAVFLAAVHFIWLRKGLQLEPILYMAGIVLVLATRLLPKRRVTKNR